MNEKAIRRSEEACGNFGWNKKTAHRTTPEHSISFNSMGKSFTFHLRQQEDNEAMWTISLFHRAHDLLFILITGCRWDDALLRKWKSKVSFLSSSRFMVVKIFFFWMMIKCRENFRLQCKCPADHKRRKKNENSFALSSIRVRNDDNLLDFSFHTSQPELLELRGEWPVRHLSRAAAFAKVKGKQIAWNSCKQLIDM